MQIEVTVITTAYNHEQFIASTIEGIVHQKTNFPFELIIHDDASTDRTAEIIRTYQKRYPEIVKPIFQTENQYSRGRDIYSILLPKVQGKYVALCEGDDCWLDLGKLQKQYDFMKSHLDYIACVHNSIVEEFTTGKKGLLSLRQEEGELTFADVSAYGGSAYQTSSLFVEGDLFRSSITELPACFRMCPEFGDYQFSMFLAASGRMWYMPDSMSIYRRFTPSSWTKAQSELSLEIQERRLLGIIAMLDSIDSHYKRKFHHELKRAKNIKIRELHTLYQKNNRVSPAKLARLIHLAAGREKLLIMKREVSRLGTHKKKEML